MRRTTHLRPTPSLLDLPSALDHITPNMQDLQTTLSALSNLLIDGQADMETQSVLSDISYQYEDYGDNIRISAVRPLSPRGPEQCTSERRVDGGPLG